ncbi:uncharacterized protein LOC141499006 [Macrotis lagotis]|uniref:uncharacterized protein LOC141499006 n=1 Tax=Macrotis lagotis TaxID=92651 RepID=UPI003D694FA1
MASSAQPSVLSAVQIPGNRSRPVEPPSRSHWQLLPDCLVHQKVPPGTTVLKGAGVPMSPSVASLNNLAESSLHWEAKEPGLRESKAEEVEGVEEVEMGERGCHEEWKRICQQLGLLMSGCCARLSCTELWGSLFQSRHNLVTTTGDGSALSPPMSGQALRTTTPALAHGRWNTLLLCTHSTSLGATGELAQVEVKETTIPKGAPPRRWHRMPGLCSPALSGVTCVDAGMGSLMGSRMEVFPVSLSTRSYRKAGLGAKTFHLRGARKAQAHPKSPPLPPAPFPAPILVWLPAQPQKAPEARSCPPPTGCGCFSFACAVRRRARLPRSDGASAFPLFPGCSPLSGCSLPGRSRLPAVADPARPGPGPGPGPGRSELCSPSAAAPPRAPSSCVRPAFSIPTSDPATLAPSWRSPKRGPSRRSERTAKRGAVAQLPRAEPAPRALPQPEPPPSPLLRPRRAPGRPVPVPVPVTVHFPEDRSLNSWTGLRGKLKFGSGTMYRGKTPEFRIQMT